MKALSILGIGLVLTSSIVYGFTPQVEYLQPDTVNPGGTDAAKNLAPAVPPLLGDSKAIAPPPFKQELWGRTQHGDGYIYGPTFRSAGVVAVDIDLDGDNDFIVPGDISNDFAPQVFWNLGASGAFFPGALKSLVLQGTPASNYPALSMDFEDVTGDGLPDLLYEMNLPNYQSGMAWYRNLGPVNAPAFQYVGGVTYTTSNYLWVDWADLNGDGKQDLFFVEAFLDQTTRNHRVFWVRNTGTVTAPVWNMSNKQEITALSNLLPARLPLKSAKDGAPDSYAVAPGLQKGIRGGMKAGYGYGISDFHIVNWDNDSNGTLDFMYYDMREGVHWIKNLGTAQAPQWDTAVTSAGNPRYDHRLDDMSIVEGTFSLCRNPDPVRRKSEWLDEFYISVDGWLMTWRYVIASDGKSGDAVKDYVRSSKYRLIQENSLVMPAGQGSIAFWDFDGDGDLDMFRMGVGYTTLAYLMLVPNIGAPYAPAWGAPITTSLVLSVGNAANEFRQDQFQFADEDRDGYSDLFVQGQDGRIKRYMTVGSVAPDPPTFYVSETDFGGVVLSGQTGVQPRGLAIANFNLDTNDWQQLIAAYGSNQGGKIIYYDPYYWDSSPVDISTGILLDGAGNGLNPMNIESLAATDLDRDGRPDLVVTVTGNGFYRDCWHYCYRNVPRSGGQFAFEFLGSIQAIQDFDPNYARQIGFADVDADGDDDLFVGHEWRTQYSSASPWHYLWFYRNTGATGRNFWRTRVVSGQSWNLRVGGVLPNYSWVVNASGGTLTNPGRYSAGSTSSAVDIIDSSNNYRVYIDVLPPLSVNESKAIIVVGSDATDPLYGTFTSLASYAYWVLRMEGLPVDSIRLYAPTDFDADGDGANNVTGRAKLSTLEPSIKQWAAGSQRLLVYLLDHGQRDRFRMNATEYLNASVYAGWLNTLQAANTGLQVTTVIDTCEAGSFISALKLTPAALSAGVRRFTIASSNMGPTQGIALFDASQKMSFSMAFWQAIFNGESYGEAFTRAKVAIECINPLQAPQIDDNGNGISNEASDGLLAKSARPGASFEMTVPGVFIGEIAPNQSITNNTATLWLSDVIAGFPVEKAGALIVPPNFQRQSASSGDEQPVTGMQWIDFSYNSSNGHWQGTYGGFSVGGLYRVQYYVQAGGRYHASPRIGYVDRLNIADAWEVDDTASQARWLPINTVQGHNFHKSGDVDWVRFASPGVGVTGTIAVLSPGHRCRPLVRLYGSLSAPPLAEVTSGVAGKGVTFTHTFSSNQTHFLRVSNADSAVYGVGTSYMAMVAVGTGGLAPTTLVVSAVDGVSKAALGGVVVTFDSTHSTTTTSDGVAMFVCPSYKQYALTAAKTGYNTWAKSVNVNTTLASVTATLVHNGAPVPGDIDGNYSVDAVDVQLVINAALGIGIGGRNADINGDARVDAVDVQLVINAALGIT